MLIKDSNLTIMVKDMDRSISFYVALGFKVIHRWSNYYAQLTGGGLVIGIHPAEAGKVPGSGTVSIGFTTNEFDNCRKLLKEISVNAQERTEEGGEFLHFNDPDGTALYFYNPKR